MISFKVNGNKYKVPTRYEDVTAGQYIELLSLTPGLLEYVAYFTGIPRETLATAELKHLENIATALFFLNTPPEFKVGATPMVGPYVMPRDITLQSVGQFEDLRALMNKAPTKLETKEDMILIHSLYLEACAIYTQKVKHGKYDYSKVAEVKEELKNYSCMEVLQTGAFFLFRPLTMLRPTMTRSQNIRQRLKRLIQDFPGFHKTLDSLQPSSGKPKE